MQLLRSRQAIILLTLFAVVALLVLFTPEQQQELRELAPLPVVVSPVRRADLQPEITVSGRLQPSRRSLLRFEVQGVVSERLVEPGQKVEAGAVLLRLDDNDYQDALIQAQADLQLQEKNLQRDRDLLKLAARSRELQEEELARLNQLGERSLASKTLLGNAAALLVQRRSEEAHLSAGVATGPQRVSVAKAALNRAQRNLHRSVLTAPFSGLVNKVDLEIGDVAGRNQPAVELIDRHMDFYAQVRGKVARSLQLGQQVTVAVDGERASARIVSIQPDPDPETYTHAIRLRMPTSEGRSGMVANAILPLRPLDAVLVVAATAVLVEEGSAFVFIVRDNRLQRMEVKPGSRVGSQQVLLSGVEAGDRVVVRDVAALADGLSVMPESMD